MCKISEDLIFDEPYFNAPMNRHTQPYLDDIAQGFKQDTALKLAVQEMKARFLSNAEALLHADLHTGSVMVTEIDTRAIDPEFAFYGPMGFDVGAILANLWMAVFAQGGYPGDAVQRQDYARWVFDQSQRLWDVFANEFTILATARDAHAVGGDLVSPRLYADSPSLAAEAVAKRLKNVWQDTLGFAACKIIRRILGLAHVEDFEVIEDKAQRAKCEKRALDFARNLLVHCDHYAGFPDLAKELL